MAQRRIKYGVGLDPSKEHIYACFGCQTEQQEFKVIATRRFANTSKGHKQLADWIRQKRKDPSLPWQIFLEVTGVYHEAVLYYLHSLGYPICLLLAKRVKKYLQSNGYDSKNDKEDAKGIAQMACEQKRPLWEPASPHILQIRSLLRHRKALVTSRDQFKNQLHALKAAHFQQRTVKSSLKEIIEQLDTRIQEIEKEAVELAQKDEELYRKVRQITDSVKGLGIITVLTVVAETNGFKKIYSIKQLVSYAGYDVVENSSGKFKGKTRISKQGNARLRAAMYMPALTVIRSQVEPFYSLYTRLLVRNGGLKKKALVAVQRKLLVLIYTLWKKDEPFIENFHEKQKARKKQENAEKLVAPM